MVRRTFETNAAAGRGRPWSQGAMVGALLFTSPISGVDLQTGIIPDDPQRQADLAFENLFTLLAEAGMTMDNVGHLAVWYRGHEHRRYLPAPWGRSFPDPDDRPVRHSMVKDFEGPAAIQLEAIAVEGARRRSVPAIPGVWHGNPAVANEAIPFGARLGDFVFSAATIGRNGATGETPTTVEGRASQAFENNRIFLELLGLSEDSVAHLVSWYSDHRQRTALGPGWSRHFAHAGSQPAWNGVVRRLPGGGAGVQLEIVAVAGVERITLGVPDPSGAGDRAASMDPHGCRLGTTFFSSAVSGIATFSAAGAGGAVRQTEVAFERVQALLDRAGFGLRDVGRVGVWLSAREHAAAVDRVWERMFPRAEDQPARHDVVSDLRDGALVELEVIAAR